ncbi:hypothetical protein HU200_062638 [Digitaria exilis]|uniref:Uncharacterized protein n=1 Tax=Digitaria exilis TaxID=1010633 RepID=A0A835DVX2_9POAL|nr:hypothetical protein HU200_062638 [Digitaria exilis]
MPGSSPDMNGEATAKKDAAARRSPFMLLFAHADKVDMVLMLLGLVGAVGDGISYPVNLIVFIRITNDVGRGPDLLQEFSSRINESARITVFLALAYWVLAFLEGYCWARTAERQASRMRARYLRAVLRQDVEYFDLRSGTTSEVVTSVSNDSLVVQDALAEKVPSFVMAISMFLGCLVLGFTAVWKLTLVALPSVLLLVVPGIVYGRVHVGIAHRIREQYALPATIAEQAVSSVRTVYSFAAEETTVARFSAALEESVRLGLKLGLAKGLAIGTNAVTFAVSAFTLWYGSRLVMYHGYQGGAVFAVSNAIVNGGLALGSGLSNVKYISEAISAAERIQKVIQRVPKIDSASDAGEDLADVAGVVEFKNVEFCYPSRPESPILVRFSLRVMAGRTVALVGSSGSGKSTVLALLQRFYDPSAGVVALDGVDIRRLRLKWLRAQMGLVSQEPVLFAATIRENILFGKEDATAEEIIGAAKAANAHDFISKLPQGYDTQVGERGVQMSGGQKQRIAIARAIVKSPKILLLDEATSALDTESEHIVQDALDLASAGRTTIIIAHRLSTIRNADTIVGMQSGEVMELGSHDELIANEDGLYKFHQLRQTNHSSEVVKANGASGASFDVEQSKTHNRIRRFSSASRSSSAKSLGDPSDNDGTEKPALHVPSFKRLLMLNAPECKQAIMGSFSAIVCGAIQPAHAYGLGSVVSAYFLTDHAEIKEKTRTYVLLFVALAVLSFLLSTVQHYNFGSMGEQLTKRIRERMLTKLLTFEIGWFDRDENSTGAICSQLAKDTNGVRSLVGDRMALVIQTVSSVLVSWSLGLVIALRLAVVMIAVQPVMIISFYARHALLKNMSKKSRGAQSKSSKLAAEAISNFRTITSFSSQDRIIRLFEEMQDGPRKDNIRQSWLAGLVLGTSLFVINCTFALVIWYGSMLMVEHRITAKELLQTFIIITMTGRLIGEACSMTADLAKGADAVASVIAILDRETKIDSGNPEGYNPGKLKGEVEILDVDFAYPSRPDVIIFKGFSLIIQPGKSTALVGKSGSGKSTIVGLIERFYDPIAGVVKIDNRDIRSYNLRAIRQYIGLVSQEPTLFAGTIKENIMYGTETASEAEIESAAKSANAHDFISSLKDGYNTWCGERGFQLSGGQKQRIAIARAILKNPAILLLDEATSALDNTSEMVVQKALDRVMVGRTSVVVAHRLSTIKNCDKIVVLEGGEIVEDGTHVSLMSKGHSGTYFGLVSLQQAMATDTEIYCDTDTLGV